MAPKDNEEKDEDQSTEGKAAEIGKDIGVEPKEDIPDYEVTEEADEGAKTDGDDKPLARTREDRVGDDDRKRLTNKEKRQLRKKRLDEKFSAKNAALRQQQEIIEHQQQQLNLMAQRLTDVDGKLSNFDQAQLQQAYNAAVAAFKKAETEYTESFSGGNAEGNKLALRNMYAAQKQIDNLEALHTQRRNAMAQQRQPVQQLPKADPVVASKASEWAEQNAWFKPNSGDDDSAIADTIAAKLVNEGYDPKTNDYWDELDERLEKRGIGRTEDDEDEDDETARREPVKRRAPPVGGGSSGRGDIRGGKVQVTLPTVFVKHMKETGIWDNPESRNRAIKEYQRIQAEAQR